MCLASVVVAPGQEGGGGDLPKLLPTDLPHFLKLKKLFLSHLQFHAHLLFGSLPTCRKPPHIYDPGPARLLCPTTRRLTRLMKTVPLIIVCQFGGLTSRFCSAGGAEAVTGLESL